MKTFNLEILTPEYLFYSGEVLSITLQIPDGQIAVLADHIPIVAPVEIGAISIRTEDSIRTAFNSEGFLEVTKQYAVIFCQACEWPEEIDINRALASKKRAEERIRSQKSVIEHKATQISLARAMERLRISGMRK